MELHTSGESDIYDRLVGLLLTKRPHKETMLFYLQSNICIVRYQF